MGADRQTAGAPPSSPIGRPRGRPLLVTVAALLAIAGVATMAMAAPRSTANRLDAERERVRQIEADLQALDADARAADAQRDLAQRRLTTLRADIRRNRESLIAARAARIAAEERLTQRLLDVYSGEPPGLFELVLSADSVTTAIDSYEFVKRAAELDQRVLNGLRETSGDLAAARLRLRANEGALTANAARARARAADLAALVGDRRAVLDGAQASLAALLDEAERQAIAADQDRRAAAAAQASAEPAVDVTNALPAAPAGPATGDPAIMAHLARIAQCESGGNPQAVSSNGLYRGKYQFHTDTWRGVGGSGDPAAATESEQDARALMLYRVQGPGAWPICSYA